MAQVNKNDFVELEYTGKTKEDSIVFDTTDEKTAKENGLDNPNNKYGSTIVCVGKQFLLKGLDDQLVGKETGKEYDIDVSVEEGFGRKDAKLIQMIPTNKFKQHKIQPVPGLQVNVDGTMGLVKTVSGGRTMVDFNHPLSGKNLTYHIKVVSIIEDEKKKVEAFLAQMGVGNLDITTEDGKVTIKLHSELEKEVKEEFSKKLKEVIPSIKDVNFSLQKGDKAKQPKEIEKKDG